MPTSVLYFNELIHSPYRSGSLTTTNPGGGSNPAGYPVSNLLDPDPSKTFRWAGSYVWINLGGLLFQSNDYFQDGSRATMQVAAVVLSGIRGFVTAGGVKSVVLNVQLDLASDAGFTTNVISVQRTVYITDGMPSTIVLPVVNSEANWDAGSPVSTLTPLWNTFRAHSRVRISGNPGITIEVANLYMFEGRDVAVSMPNLSLSFIDASEVQRAYNRRPFVRERARSRAVSGKFVALTDVDVYGTRLNRASAWLENTFDDTLLTGAASPPPAVSRSIQRVNATSGSSRLVALMLHRHPCRVPGHTNGGAKTYSVTAYEGGAFGPMGAQAASYVGFLQRPLECTMVDSTDAASPVYEASFAIEELTPTLSVPTIT